MNFAETAYVLMQDVIMLLMQLRSGNVPDVVLFYNLGSDIYAAYESGPAGVPHNLAQLAARFETRPEPPPPTVVDWLRSTYAYALIDRLMGKLTVANPPQRRLITYESMGIDVTQLSDLIVQEYLGYYKIVSALAQEYGFKYFFFQLPPSQWVTSLLPPKNKK